MAWPEVIPDYGGRALSNLLPAIGAHLGVPGCDWDPFALPSARRYVVLLVDGLGWEILLAALPDAPNLSDWLPEADTVTCGVPSTTTVSLTSLGTGLTPGQHGIIGYRFWAQDLDAYLAPLSWDTAVAPEVVQPQPTLLERAAAVGVATSRVLSVAHMDSGFSGAALRGAVAIGVDERDQAGRVEAVVQAVQAPSALVYAYDRGLDHAGHSRGVASDAWLEALAQLDTYIATLRAALPRDVVLLVTGDHGMVDVPQHRRLSIESTPDLAADLQHVGGEARFRHLYTRQPAAVAARWADRLGQSASVQTQAAAIAAGWFGPVGALARGRLGDVIVAVRDDSALLSRRTPYEARLVGMHGALTRAEMVVPLFTLTS